MLSFSVIKILILCKMCTHDPQFENLHQEKSMSFSIFRPYIQPAQAICVQIKPPIKLIIIQVYIVQLSVMLWWMKQTNQKHTKRIIKNEWKGTCNTNEKWKTTKSKTKSKTKTKTNKQGTVPKTRNKKRKQPCILKRPNKKKTRKFWYCTN